MHQVPARHQVRLECGVGPVRMVARHGVAVNAKWLIRPALEIATALTAAVPTIHPLNAYRGVARNSLHLDGLEVKPFFYERII